MRFGSWLKNMRSWRQAARMGFLCSLAMLSLGDRVRSSFIQGKLGVELLLLHIKRSLLRWFVHLIRIPPPCLPLEMSHWEKALWRTQNLLEGLCMFTDLGTPWIPPGGERKCNWGEWRLSFSLVASKTRLQINGGGWRCSNCCITHYICLVKNQLNETMLIIIHAQLVLFFLRWHHPFKTSKYIWTIWNLWLILSVNNSTDRKYWKKMGQFFTFCDRWQSLWGMICTCELPHVCLFLCGFVFPSYLFVCLYCWMPK